MTTWVIIVIIAAYLILVGIISYYMKKAKELEETNESLVMYADNLFDKIDNLKKEWLKDAHKAKLYDDLMKKYRYALFSCSSCGKIMSKKNTNWINEKPYCGRCKNAQK